MKISELPIRDEISRILIEAGITTIEEFCQASIDDLKKVRGMTAKKVIEIRRALRKSKGGDIISFPGNGGRPKGSKDKVPGSEARRKAGRKNAWVNGNGSHRTENDFLDFGKTQNVMLDSGFVVSSEDVKRYGNLYRAALNGEHHGLEDEMCSVLGHMYGLYKELLFRIAGHGMVDIPIYALNDKGEVLQDQNGDAVIKALKVPKGTLDLMSDLRKALGVDLAEWALTARSQGRTRKISDDDVLRDVEESFEQLEEARNNFKRRKMA